MFGTPLSVWQQKYIKTGQFSFHDADTVTDSSKKRNKAYLILKKYLPMHWNLWYLSLTVNVKNYLSWVKIKRHLSIGVFIVYIDTGSPVLSIPSKSRDLADENKKFLTEWIWFETSVLNSLNTQWIYDTEIATKENNNKHFI